MKYLKLQNKGEIDIRLISLLGGTTKTGNAYKIGRFGTGLKYALAWLVRNNIDFKIFVGEKEIKITTQREHIQGSDFDIIYIDGQRSSIAASTGADWMGWMVIREVYCNAIDEGEHIKEITSDLFGIEGATTFYIQIVDEIKEAVDNWQHYFLRDITPLYETEQFAVYPSTGTLSIYKQGILIHENKDTKSVFAYDVKNASINELREYKGYLTYDLFQIISQLDKKCVEIFLNNLNSDCHEHTMDYNWGGEFNDSWKEAIGQGKIIAEEDLVSLKERGVDVDEATLIPMPKTLFEKLSNRFEGISAVRRADKVSAFWETFDSECELKVSAAKAILENAGYELSPELKYIYGHFGDKTKFAQISQDKKEVLISTELKRQSMFDIVTTVVEEEEHYKTSFGDCTRKFQQHFINLYVKGMLNKTEIEL